LISIFAVKMGVNQINSCFVCFHVDLCDILQHASIQNNDDDIHDTSDHILWDRSPNIVPLISRWELDKFKNC
jgi:hypothetical protein